MTEYVDAPYQKSRMSKFEAAHIWKNRIDRNKKNSIFPSSVRIRVISYLLKDAKYGPEISDKGISRLLELGAYEDAYPLHDGEITLQGKEHSNFRSYDPDNDTDDESERKTQGKVSIISKNWLFNQKRWQIQKFSFL